MAGSSKLDLYVVHKDEYAAPRDPILVTIKAARYLAIQGRGEPGGQAFQDAVGALYNVAFTVKMARKKAGRDYTVCKLEALWWGKRPHANFLTEPKSTWHWQLLIRVPDWIQSREVADTAEGLVAKGKDRLVMNVELLVLHEGRSVQVLHVGPYDQEAATVRHMAGYAEMHHLAFHGKHHEIYLSDPRRVAPAKLRTILRYPVA